MDKDKLLLELGLLKYWKSHDVKFLYKYKHRVKEYQGGNLTNTELFLDLTGASIFSDIVDIANFSDKTGKEVKIAIDELIEKREKELNQIN